MSKVRILSPYPHYIWTALDKDEIVTDGGDWLISFGHNKILKPDELKPYDGRALNIHIGILPDNRGADPNFWSWFNNTKKGVTIHEIDNDLDAGPIVAQAEITKFREPMTLASTYEELMFTAGLVFAITWPGIKAGTAHRVTQTGFGSFHFRKDKTPFMKRLPLVWNTPVSEVEKMGDDFRRGLL